MVDGRKRARLTCVDEFVIPNDAGQRTEILADAKAKRESALRHARTGSAGEEEYWLGIAGRMTEWIGHLERRDGDEIRLSGPARARPRHGIDLPAYARRSQAAAANS